MKHVAKEIIGRVEGLTKDTEDVQKVTRKALNEILKFRHNHPAVSGTLEAAIGISAIAAGFHLVAPGSIAYGPYAGKIPELVGAACGSATGAGVAATAASIIGGIGIAAMGTAFAIPAAAVTAIAAAAGATVGALAGWLGGSAASQAASLAETLFLNVSGLALIAFGIFMLTLALKDLWRAGGNFIEYIKNFEVREIEMPNGGDFA